MSYTEKDVEEALRLTDKATDLTIENCMRLHDHFDQFTETEQWEIARKVAAMIENRRGK